jgi:hypothetical protein
LRHGSLHRQRVDLVLTGRLLRYLLQKPPLPWLAKIRINPLSGWVDVRYQTQ